MRQSFILITEPEKNYELIDSGSGAKIERYGNFILRRPDPQALWQKTLPEKEWQKADGWFKAEKENAGWHLKSGVPEEWPIEFSGLKFLVKPTPFKHTGVFPEQKNNWGWIANCIAKSLKQNRKEISIINLFGYTGGASLVCAKSGAKVCHIDGSKTAIAWAKKNAEISKLADKPIRWILDDALAFLRREIKRQKQYDGIIMDPPAFGRGPKGEVWKIEKDFPELMELCQKILSPNPLFFLINGYASGYSSIAYENNLIPILKKYGGRIESGELAIRESKAWRLLPCGIFSRWESEK